MYARNIVFIEDHAVALEQPDRIAEMREHLLAGDVYIARRVMPEPRLHDIREYLKGIAMGSLPNYHRVEVGCPNFHRLDRWDPRAYVKSCFHTWSFFPWNHDVFGLFNIFRPVYWMKNQLSGLPRDSFLNNEPERGCTARLSFHYYPKGIGGLNRHQDPFDYHQITVPVMNISRKGKDFKVGGAYVDKNETERVILDDITNPGDAVYFNAQTFHGVECIDPDAEEDWMSFQGRWMILFAVNQVAGHSAIKSSTDLGESNSNLLSQQKTP